MRRHDERLTTHLHSLNAQSIVAGTMSNEVSEGELIKVRDWANGQLTKGGEQPWSTFLLVRLAETIDALLAGRAKPSQRIVANGTFRTLSPACGFKFATTLQHRRSF